MLLRVKIWLKMGERNQSMLSCVWLFATPWTVACHVPLSMRYSWQEYQSGLPFPSPGDLPDPGIEGVSLTSPALAAGFFTTEPPGKKSKFLPLWSHYTGIIPLRVLDMMENMLVHASEIKKKTSKLVLTYGSFKTALI